MMMMTVKIKSVKERHFTDGTKHYSVWWIYKEDHFPDALKFSLPFTFVLDANRKPLPILIKSVSQGN